MSLTLKIRSTKFIKSETLKNVEKGNLEIIKFLKETSDEKIAIDSIVKYIKSDCDKALIAYYKKEIAGILFLSFSPSKENIVKVKQQINKLPNNENRELLKFITNYRNLVNVYKYELSERFENMIFLDFLFLNKKYNKIEVRNFLYEAFINELNLQKIPRFFCVDINHQFAKLYENIPHRVLNEQLVSYRLNSKAKLKIELLEIALTNNEFKKESDDVEIINIFGDHIETNHIYHSTIPCKNPDIQTKILMIHGTASNHTTWDGIIDKLTDFANLELIDLPLHGASNIQPYTDKKWDIFTLSMFVAKYIKQQNWNNLIVWGHSLGGGVAISLKQLLPKEIIGLILEDPYNSGALENTKKYITTGIKTLRDARKDLGKNNVSISRSKWTFALDVYRPLTHNTIVFLRSLFSKTIMNYLDWAYCNNTSPTLVCFGKDDIVINPNLSKKYFDSLGSSYNFKIIKKAGHSLHKDNPDELLKLVTKFVKSNFNN